MAGVLDASIVLRLGGAALIWWPCAHILVTSFPGSMSHGRVLSSVVVIRGGVLHCWYFYSGGLAVDCGGHQKIFLRVPLSI